MPQQLPIIQQISTLRSAGLFDDYRADASLSTFARYNLIYGFNGSGKTTLSRVFASLENGVISKELPQGCSFSIQLSDGSTIGPSQNLEALKDRVLVFNVDFVRQNLQWSEGTANPVYYIGKDQTDLASDLEQIEADLGKLQTERGDKENEKSRSETAFTTYKRDLARSIERELTVLRGYNARHLTNDYEGRSLGKDYLLSDEEIKEQRSILNQDSPLPKCRTLEIALPDLSDFAQDLEKVLNSTIGTRAIEELTRHPDMLKWVKEGSDYHIKHQLSTCLFCGNEVVEERLDAFREALGQEYDDVVSKVNAKTQEVEGLRRSVQQVEANLPSRNDIAKNLQVQFEEEVNELSTALRMLDGHLQSCEELLHQKTNSPAVAPDLSGLPKNELTKKFSQDVEARMTAVNKVIESHNKIHDDFNRLQEEAKEKLKNYLLEEGRARFEELRNDVEQHETDLQRLKKEQESLTERRDETKQKMRQHGPAAEQVNKMVQAYLGHNELQIKTSDTGYLIERKQAPVNGSLSEGEKTAIALCYFMSTLEAEGRRKKNLIVVIDDPVSSLDTKALHYAFSMIKATFADVCQLIVMTHNLHFMNEVKKWLKPKTEKGNAALFFLEVVEVESGQRRRSSVRPMPKLIRDYESEYQYLFHLVLKFAQIEEERQKYFYVMPNVLRKVLEIFLAFKLPGPEGLANKIANIADGEKELDAARIQALDRLTQLESHADNLDDLITFSSMTIEETLDAAKALLHLMETTDAEHYQKLCRICG